MTDIVERLRKGKFVGGKLVMQEAADEIERLRKALRPFAKQADLFDSLLTDEEDFVWRREDLQLKHYRNARAALRRKGDGHR